VDALVDASESRDTSVGAQMVPLALRDFEISPQCFAPLLDEILQMLGFLLLQHVQVAQTFWWA
jgi:hypothetical protein